MELDPSQNVLYDSSKLGEKLWGEMEDCVAAIWEKFRIYENYFKVQQIFCESVSETTRLLFPHTDLFPSSSSIRYVIYMRAKTCIKFF